MSAKLNFLQQLRSRLLEEYQSRQLSWQGNKRPETIISDSAVTEISLPDYHILRKIGQGGMGVVYEALHIQLGRKVAIKVLQNHLHSSQSIRQRFLREMKTAGQLSHPRIVQAFDARDDETGPISLVFELLEGVDVARRLREGGKLAIATACEIARQTAEGLQYTYEKGLVHRDIKPSNLFLAFKRDAQGMVQGASVKILDLGLAAMHSSQADDTLTSLGQVVGTIDYIAPEQIQGGRNIDVRADLYSLGCTMYHLLSGAAPFAHCSGTYEKLCAHKEQLPPVLCEIVDEIPEELSQIVDRLLAKNPDERFATPDELIDALKPFCAGANLLNAIPDADRMLAAVDILPPTRQVTFADQSSRERNLDTLSTSVLHRRRLLWGSGILTCCVLGLATFMQSSESPTAVIAQAPTFASQEISSKPSSVSPQKTEDFVLLLDGVDDAIDTGFHYQNGNPITFEMWLTPLATPDRRKKELVCNAEAAGISLSLKEDANLKFQLHDGKQYVPIEILNCVSNAEKMHVAAVYSGLSVQLYVNGAAAGAAQPVRQQHRPSPLSILLGTNPDPALAGRDHATLRDCFRGIIHQFRVTRGARYSENFSPTKILTADADVELLYHINSGQGETVKDLSGNQHHGTILGGTWTTVSALQLEGDSTPYSWPANAPEPAIAPLSLEDAKRHQQEWAQFLNTPVEKTLALEEGNAIELVLIPPGEFLIGTDLRGRTRLLESETLQLNDHCREVIQYEHPQHVVRITKPFYMSRFEITQQQYRVFCKETGFEFPLEEKNTAAMAEAIPDAGGQAGDPAHLPIASITWNDAVAFCEWLTEQSSLAVTLPTEAQWEFTCRAGTQTDWNFGDDPAVLGEYAWHADNSALGPHMVGQLPPNQWGLYDMHGNVAEWCHDFWRRYGYTKAARNDPYMGSQDSFHNVRGGAWSSWPILCRSSARSFQQARHRSNQVGFRIIVDLAQNRENR